MLIIIKMQLYNKNNKDLLINLIEKRGNLVNMHKTIVIRFKLYKFVINQNEEF